MHQPVNRNFIVFSQEVDQFSYYPVSRKFFSAAGATRNITQIQESLNNIQKSKVRCKVWHRTACTSDADSLDGNKEWVLGSSLSKRIMSSMPRNCDTRTLNPWSDQPERLPAALSLCEIQLASIVPYICM